MFDGVNYYGENNAGKVSPTLKLHLIQGNIPE